MSDGDARLDVQAPTTAPVSVVVVNFNAGDALLRCLQSLRGQSVRPARIIVVDNASSDGSLDAARRDFPEVEFLCLKENRGFAAANNLAVATSATEFVALLNPDAFAAPGWLEALLSAAAAWPQTAAFGSRQLCDHAPETVDGLGDVYHLSGLVWRQGHGRGLRDGDLTERPIFSPCAAAALYRRQAFVDVGGFDEDLFCYVEDVDLGFRLRLQAWQCRYVPDAVVRHAGGLTSGGGRSDFAVRYGHRNLVWVFVKNMPWPLFWLLLPAHLAMNLAALIVCVRRGQGAAILWAKKAALLGLPAVWRKRVAVQRQRRIGPAGIFSVLDRSCLVRRIGGGTG